MNIKQLFELCFQDIDSKYPATTARMYKVGLEKFREHLQLPDEVDAGQILVDHFVNFSDYLAVNDYTKSTNTVYLSAVRRLQRLMDRQDILVFTPRDTARLKDAIDDLNASRETSLPKVPKRGDAEKLMAMVKKDIYVYSPVRERDIALCTLLYNTGLRIGEAQALNVSNFDFENNLIHIKGKSKKNSNKKVNNTKGAKDANIRINEEVTLSLKAYWEKRGWSEPDDPAFARHDKVISKGHARASTTGLRMAIERVAEKAGVEFTPHKFRHNFVTKIVRETNNLNLAQKLARHSSTSMTTLYTHIEDDEIDDDYHKIFGK